MVMGEKGLALFEFCSFSALQGPHRQPVDEPALEEGEDDDGNQAHHGGDAVDQRIVRQPVLRGGLLNDDVDVVSAAKRKGSIPPINRPISE